MNCPLCGGEMWDNRQRKTNPKQPDFKCKDPQCTGVIWPPIKPKTPMVNGNGRNDPEIQKAIIRQNSLTNAVNYVLGKAQLMSKEDALKYVTGKEVIQVATYFAKYSEGSVTVVNQAEEEMPEADNSQEELTPDDITALGF
jgi:hypothetical protein